MGDNPLYLSSSDWKNAERAHLQQMGIMAEVKKWAQSPMWKEVLRQAQDPLYKIVLERAQQVIAEIKWMQMPRLTSAAFAPERPRTLDILIRSEPRHREFVNETKPLTDGERMDALQEYVGREVERLPDEQRISFLTKLYRAIAPKSEKLESGLSVMRYETTDTDGKKYWREVIRQAKESGHVRLLQRNNYPERVWG